MQKLCNFATNTLKAYLTPSLLPGDEATNYLEYYQLLEREERDKEREIRVKGRREIVITVYLISK